MKKKNSKINCNSNTNSPKDSYNEFKEFHGKKYTGMKVGRSHSWHYDKGDWKEKKQTSDLWTFNYNVTKHRAGKAPEGAGVPLGTGYHWYILAHQNVRNKLDANTYSTAMRGYKYKLAHKRADKENWNTNSRGQRKRLIKVYQSIIHQLEQEEIEENQAKKQKANSKKHHPKSYLNNKNLSKGLIFWRNIDSTGVLVFCKIKPSKRS